MRIGRSRRRGEDVDDAAPHRELAAVLDLVLAAVAGVDEARDEVLEVELRAPADDDRLGVFDPSGRAAAGAPSPGRRRRGVRGAAATAAERRGAGATSCAAGGPSSRSPARPARRAASPRPAGARPPRRRRRPRSCTSCSASPAVAVATSSGRRAAQLGEARRARRSAPRPGPRRRRRRRRAARRAPASPASSPGRRRRAGSRAHLPSAHVRVLNLFIAASGPSSEQALDRVGGHLDGDRDAARGRHATARRST